MKRNKIASLALSVLLLSTLSCQDNDLSPKQNPFDLTSENDPLVRNKIVVISDLHLGSDTSYSENVRHLPRLAQFLGEIRESETVKELVIAGDMLDEWYVPSRNDTYKSETQEAFIRRIASQNKIVIDVL